MPVNPAVKQLAQDGRFTLRDAQTLKQAVTAGTVSQAEARDVLSRYAEAMDQDASALVSDTFGGTPRAKISQFPDGFTDQTLQRGQRGDNVTTLQRGLMAAGLSSNNAGMTLPTGADGIFGRDTENAVKAFQRSNGIPETGKADPVTLRALQQAMAGTAPSQSRPATTPTPTTQTVRPSTGLRRAEAATAPAAAAGAPTTTAATTTAAPTTTTATTTTTTTAAATTAAATTAATTTAAATTAAATTAAVTTTTAAATPPSPAAGAPAATPAPVKSPTVVPLSAGVQPGTAAGLVDAATTLATGERAKNYGTVNPWFNVDPSHTARVDQRMGGLKDRWKCNLFGGNALAAGGFEAPRYGNKTPGEYPVAEDWNKWATPTAEAKARAAAEGHPIPDYAKSNRNASRFDLQDEVRPPSLGCSDAEKRARVQAFLDRVQPGDVVTVDHPGAAGSDGGHVRVCVGRDPVTNNPLFAQAKNDAAHVLAETADNFLHEDAMFILRPNTPITSGAAR